MKTEKMAEDTYFKPRKVTDPNDRLDEDGNWCIRGLFRHTQAIAHKVECHDKSANTDGYIELVWKNRSMLLHHLS